MTTNNSHRKLAYVLTIIVALAGLNVWQYQRGLAKENENGTDNVITSTGLGPNAADATHSSQLLPQPHDPANRQDMELAPVDPTTSRVTIGPQIEESATPPAGSSLEEDLRHARRENDDLRTKAYFAELLQSESETLDSLKVSSLLAELDFSKTSIDSINLETRVCLRGMELTEEEILWMADCAETGIWPVKDRVGDGQVQLSLAKQFGPERLSRELDMVSLWNMLNEPSSHEGVSSVWGKHLATVYWRFPPKQREWMESAFFDSLKSAGVDL